MEFRDDCIVCVKAATQARRPARALDRMRSRRKRLLCALLSLATLQGVVLTAALDYCASDDHSSPQGDDDAERLAGILHAHGMIMTQLIVAVSAVAPFLRAKPSYAVGPEK